MRLPHRTEPTQSRPNIAHCTHFVPKHTQWNSGSALSHSHSNMAAESEPDTNVYVFESPVNTSEVLTLVGSYVEASAYDSAPCLSQADGDVKIWYKRDESMQPRGWYATHDFDLNAILAWAPPGTHHPYPPQSGWQVPWGGLEVVATLNLVQDKYPWATRRSPPPDEVDNNVSQIHAPHK